MKAVLVALLALAAAAPQKRTPPTVELSYASVVGSSADGIDSFLGIPYAQPPVDDLRLRPPRAITTNLGSIQATAPPLACPQSGAQPAFAGLPPDVLAKLLATLSTTGAAGEDCLTLNVQRPASATATSKLPVVFWIFGGGFESGSTQSADASRLIAASVAQGREIVYVAVNYRLGAFGFLGGREVLAAGAANLGLLDQRLALEWVADNIAQFGGDPDKVTIWGQSAGSISVLDQLALYGGDHTYKNKPLFRAAIMDSGSIAPADPVDCAKAQAVYAAVVGAAGCAVDDSLACLRALPYDRFLAAAGAVPSIASYSGLALSYMPRPDGLVLPDSPDVLVQHGRYAAVPLIIGDQEDEGTLFSLQQANITTGDQLVDYLNAYLFRGATRDQVQGLVDTYPDDAAAGSPFGSGDANNVYPQFKRLAAMQGDLVFTLARRLFLTMATAANPDVPCWSYLSTYLHGLPILGTFHGSDVAVAYGSLPGTSLSVQTYYLNFFHSMDPGAAWPAWPQWSAERQLMNFRLLSERLIGDDFRQASYQYLSANARAFYV
jgi:acetylcholinesterase